MTESSGKLDRSLLKRVLTRRYFFTDKYNVDEKKKEKNDIEFR